MPTEDQRQEPIDFDLAFRRARACYFAGGAGELPPSEMLRSVLAAALDPAVKVTVTKGCPWLT